MEFVNYIFMMDAAVQWIHIHQHRIQNGYSPAFEIPEIAAPSALVEHRHNDHLAISNIIINVVTDET